MFRLLLNLNIQVDMASVRADIFNGSGYQKKKNQYCIFDIMATKKLYCCMVAIGYLDRLELTAFFYVI